jgi:hypothetical protein
VSDVGDLLKAKARVDKIKKIVTNCQAEKIDGVLVDLQSAQLFMRCYGMTQSLKVKHAMEVLPIDKVIATCWKSVPSPVSK